MNATAPGAWSRVDLETSRPVKWAKVIDQTRCIGCHACSTACKSENEVPLSVHRTYVKNVDVGVFPNARRAFQVTRCNQCDNPPCVTACPTSAMYRRKDGIVDFDKDWCIGCKACIAACPYDAIFINPQDHTAEKCNFCAHRLEGGLEPACVVVCPTQAILVGDLNDPASKVATIVNREVVSVRKPEKDTRPKLFYKGAHMATLDPLSATRPSGGLFMWSEQAGHLSENTIASGSAAHTRTTSAAAVLSYDIPHNRPWDWRVSAYTWTKAISSGVYLVAALALFLGKIDEEGSLWRVMVPVVSGFFLALTGALLIADLKQPRRFYYLFLRPQWKSWLVRGGVLIAAFTGVLVVHFLYGILGNGHIGGALTWIGVPLAAGTAIYTAYLFAQAKARDLWQNPLLPPHFVVQALLAGFATLRLCNAEDDVAAWLTLGVSLLSALHLALVGGELSLTHATAHARVAASEITSGSYRGFFAAALLLTIVGVFGAAAGFPSLAASCALFGLLAWEHAHVQAGQAVPLA